MKAAAQADFAKMLKKLREDAHLSQEELAHELNMTQSHVSKYECNRKVIDLETLLRWVQVTNTEAQAAIIIFGTDIIMHASQLITLAQSFIPIYLPFLL